MRELTFEDCKKILAYIFKGDNKWSEESKYLLYNKEVERLDSTVNGGWKSTSLRINWRDNIATVNSYIDVKLTKEESQNLLEHIKDKIKQKEEQRAEQKKINAFKQIEKIIE